MPEVGSRAPDFELYDAEKKQRKMSEFLRKGHKTVFAFFPGAFTSVCTQEMCTFRDMYGELQNLSGDVVGISVDAPWAQKTFADINKLTFPLLCDFDRKTVKDYGVVWNGLGGVEGYVSANRAIFVVDDSGVVRYRWVAPNPGTLPNFEEIKQALH
jgi:peroxiredoxin